ncbi:MAG: hypothetical protein QHH09_02205 [Microgenomates group bacterium]|nr:hypothetical protein [Microgenomates group bacterium]
MNVEGSLPETNVPKRLTALRLADSKELRELIGASMLILTASVVEEPGLTGKEKELVLSRAHLSMPLAFAQLEEKNSRLPVVDVGRYLLTDAWQKMSFVGEQGRRVARSLLLRKGHELMAPILRQGLPLEEYLRAETEAIIEAVISGVPAKPIVTFHYAVGNLAADFLSRNHRSDIPVIHYVTDPYVHPNYLKYKNLPFVYYFTFDEATRVSLIKQGVPPERVFCTGFPLAKELEVNIDLANLETKKQEYNYFLGGRKKLRVGVFTGGLGGNQEEILTIAKNLDYRFQQGVFYCGTNADLKEKLVRELKRKGIAYRIHDVNESLTVKKDDQAVIIFGENLTSLLPLSYQALNWSQVVCSKPSGDIGIESLMAGKLFVALANWGRHEARIREILEETGAVIPIKNLSKIGTELFDYHRHKDLVGQIERLLTKLNQEPPFPYNWRERVKEALAKILPSPTNSLNSPFPV